MEPTERNTAFDKQNLDSERLESSIADEPVLAWRGAFLLDHPDAGMYLVGGAVRDALLGRKNKDFDFVVRGIAPSELASWYERRGRIDLTGRNFGVYKFLPENFSAKDTEFVDIAFPRTEHSSADSLGGYRDFDTQVDANLSIEDDLGRRDFTVNAMAYDTRGRSLVDPFGGRADLEAKILRAVNNPAERFREDMSRILRAIRFACQLNFAIEPETWKALQDKMADINMKRTRPDGQEEYVVPRETVGKEIAKALLADPANAVKLLNDSGAIRELWPEIAEHIERDPEYLVPLNTPERLDPTAAATVLLRALKPGEAKMAAEAAGLNSLPAASPARVNTESLKWVIEFLKSEPRNPSAMPGAEFERIFMNERGKTLLSTMKALGKNEFVEAATTRVKAIRERCRAAGEEKIEPLVTGRDVIDLGLKPGPAVRILLERARSAQLDGSLTNREQALAWLKEQPISAT